MLSPEGRVVLISGANRGIGLAVARNLYEAGYTLSLGARNRASVDAVTEGWDTERMLTHAIDRCREQAPAMDLVAEEHTVVCHRWRELAEGVGNRGMR